MDGSDDFYFDDVTAADIAVLEEVESKYNESQRTQALQRKASQSQLPSAKRQKTTHVHQEITTTQLKAPAAPIGSLARSSSLHAVAAGVVPDVPLPCVPPVPRLDRNGRTTPAPINNNKSQHYPSNRPDAYVPLHSTFAIQLEHPLTAVRHLMLPETTHTVPIRSNEHHHLHKLGPSPCNECWPPPPPSGPRMVPDVLLHLPLSDPTHRNPLRQRLLPHLPLHLLVVRQLRLFKDLLHGITPQYRPHDSRRDNAARQARRR